MLKRWLLLLFALCAWLLPSASFAQDVYETCAEIKVLAKQIMSEENYAYLSAMSEQECVDRFGHRTRAQLKSYLAKGKYLKYWKNPLDIGTVTQVDTDYESDKTGHTIHIETDGGGHIHLPQGGVIGTHGGSRVWLLHRWDNAGRKQRNIRVSLDLLHHTTGQNHHFDDVRDLDTEVKRYGRTSDGDYIFYKQVRTVGTKGPVNEDGEFTTYRLKVSYKFQVCQRSNQTACFPWIPWVKWKKCYAGSSYVDHKRSPPHCYIVE